MAWTLAPYPRNVLGWPDMRSFERPHDFMSAVGQELGCSDWHEVTQAHIDQFAAATGDQQWIHTDPVRAAAGPFGATIAHGFLTVAMIPKFMWEVSEVITCSMVVNYGLNKVRFPAPVPVGSRLRGRFVVGEVTETDRGVTVVQQVTIEIEGGAKPACVAESVILYVP